jgi:phosphatidylglycerophosphate synthase
MRQGWNKKSALNTREITLKPVNRVIQPFVQFLYKYTPVTPNDITITNFFIGLAALFFMGISGHIPDLFGMTEYSLRLTGAILTSAYIIFDSMDGQLARGGKLTSGLGHWLDSTMDSIMFPAFLLSLAIGMNNYWALFIGGFAALCFPLQFLLQFKFKIDFPEAGKDSVLNTESKWRYMYGGAIFYWLNIIFAITNTPLYTLIFFATFGNLFWMGITGAQYLTLRKG